jgi:hypothetical protein
MNTALKWFEISKYILSAIIGIYAWWKIIYPNPLNRTSRINGIIVLALAIMIATASNYIVLIYYIVSFYLIPTLGTFLVIIFLPFNMFIKKLNKSLPLLGTIQGIEYGILSSSLFLIFINLIDYDLKIYLVLLIFLSSLLNNIQRIIMKEADEKKYEYYVMGPELLILLVFSIYLIFK